MGSVKKSLKWVTDDVLGFDPNGGGLYSIPVVGDIANTVVNSVVGNIIALAVPVTAPFIYAAKAAQSISQGSTLGAVLNAVAAYTAYVKPMATTSVNVAGVEVQGINKALVDSVKTAIAGGEKVLDVTKTLLGIGDANKAAEVLAEAGVSSKVAADALNTAVKAINATASTATTASDAALLARTMMNAGIDTNTIISQVTNLGVTSTQAGNLVSALGSGLSQASAINVMDTASDLSGVNWQGSSIAGSGLDVGSISGDIVYNTAGKAIGFLDDLGDFNSYADIAKDAGFNYTGSAATAIQTQNISAKDFLAADALQLAKQGLSASQIASTLSYTGLGTELLNEIANLAKNNNEQGIQNALSSSGVTGTLDALLKGSLNYYNAKENASNLAQVAKQMDPYWNYRTGTEIPLKTNLAGSTNKLLDLYTKSYTDPLSVYNNPSMQATNAAFMNEIERRDAAAGRNSQYGSRAVEAENQFLSNSLPKYQTGLQQGLQTLITGSQAPSYDTGAAANVLQQSAVANNNALASALYGLTGQTSGTSTGTTNTGAGSTSLVGTINDTVKTVKSLYDTGKTLLNLFG